MERKMRFMVMISGTRCSARTSLVNRATPIENPWRKANNMPTYVEVVSKGIQQQRVQNGEQKDEPRRVSVMVHNLPTQAKEIWTLFDFDKVVSNIILPRRRDRNNYRIGIIIVEHTHQTRHLERIFNRIMFGGNKLTVKLSKRAQRPHMRSEKIHVSSHKISMKGHSMPVMKDNVVEKEPVQQPGFHTLIADTNPELKEEINRSWIGTTVEWEWSDILQEKLNCLGFYGILIRGISHKQFLITFPDERDVNDDFKDELLKIFIEVRKATSLDLVVQRTA